MSPTTPTPAEIRALRLELKASQAAFAEVLGVSLRTIEEWEAGRSTPKPYLALAFRALRNDLVHRRDG